MPRVPVLALALASVLLLGTPAWGQTDEELEKLIAEWIAELGDEDTRARINAMSDLGHIGPKAASAVPALIVALSDEDVRVRVAAAAALGRIGPKAAPAVPALIAVLRHCRIVEMPGTSSNSLVPSNKQNATASCGCRPATFANSSTCR